MNPNRPSTIPMELLIEASRSTNLKGFVHPHKNLDRIPIEYDKKVVGFFTPRIDPDGVWRMGAIYVTRQAQGQGLASNSIRSFMKNRKGRAYIETENTSAQKAYKKPGFTLKSKGDDGGAWWENF